MSRVSASAPYAATVAHALHRLSAIDAARGLIIAFMAIDHVNAAIVRVHSVELWDGTVTRYSSALPFVLRFLSHFCAPGFFFWMGTGVALFAASRARIGWSHSRISRFLVLRGLLIIAIGQLLEFPALIVSFLADATQQNSSPPQFFVLLTVLFGLGMALAFAGLLHRLPTLAWLAMGAALVIATNALVPAATAPGIAFWQRVLYLPGFSPSLISMYPVLPWFAITSLGVAFGYAVPKVGRHTLWIGVAAVAAAIVVRAAGGFGNILVPRDSSWIEFLNLVKYPPALVFTLLFLGGNLVFYALFSKRRIAVLETFGRVPLFFYLSHLWLYVVLGALFFRRGTSHATGLLIWAASLVPLYYACRAFDRFKRSTPPDSAWRFF